jgi:anti-sigma B factor antagonist
MSVIEAPNVLLLEGEIDSHVSPGVAASLQRRIEEQQARIVVDLTAVTYIDSSGLAVLITAVNDVESYGGRLMLAGMQESVRATVASAGLTRFFLSLPQSDAALAAR